LSILLYIDRRITKIRFHRLTQIFDESEHDPSDVEVTLNPQRPFHLQIGHVDLQVPRTVADDEPVGGGHIEGRTKIENQKYKKNKSEVLFNI